MDFALQFPQVWGNNKTYFSRLKSMFTLPQRQADIKEEGRKVVILWGGTGTGKTRSVYNKYPEVYKVPAGGRGRVPWMDGYDGQEVALFDEFNGQISLPTILQMTDRYAMQVQVKGGFVQWAPKLVVFCSNVDPEMWWTDKDDHTSLDSRAAFNRRVVKVVHLPEVVPGAPPFEFPVLD